jgi:4-hydroxy-tetrahydrodipicolinate synthase
MERGRSAMFRGSLVALVTPFKDGKVDFETLDRLVDFHMKEGTSGLCPCGTTGESATVKPEERNAIIERVVRRAAGNIPVIPGTGSNSTAEAVAATAQAEERGADGALVITPYYNKPTARGLYLHFEAVARAVDIPIVLYNVPGRTGVDLPPQVVADLSKIPNIVAIKEASGRLESICEILSRCDIAVLSGDDALTLPMLHVGGVGVVSVVANLVPGDMAAMIESFEASDYEKARALHFRLFPLMKAMFLETNPIPVKTAMKLLRRLNGELRLPLCAMAPKNTVALKAVLKDCGLL